MKLSRKIRIYLIGLLFLGAVVLLAGENALQLACAALIVFYAAAGTIWMFGWCIRMEKAAELLPDMEAFGRESGSLRDATAHMLTEGMRQVDAKTKERYSAKVMDRQSRLNTLQSQINPHFLYNTLECIRSEAILCRNQNIANMAKSLAAFFRYSISRKDNIVTILDEIGNIRNYFLIQNYRFENKFTLELEVEDEERVYQCLIPKMTIQPIVENAIFHGLETKSGECSVKIGISATEDKIILVISDNGIGMSVQTLEKLRMNMREIVEEGGDDKLAHGNGIALYNVNQRIKLAFGTEYGLQVYSTEGIGTDVEIIMPVLTSLERE